MKNAVYISLLTIIFAVLIVVYDVPISGDVFLADDMMGDGSVVRVVDGDTLVVLENETEVTVRVLGINTPETVDPRRPVACFGREASDAAKEMLEGQSVTLIADNTQGDRDVYDRALRYVQLEDGTDVGLWLISSGYAYEYTHRIPYERQAAYQAAENVARTSKIGLWADGVCD